MHSRTKYIMGFLVLISTGCALGWEHIQATSDTYYVKEGGGGDGSESDPFGSIADAVDEAREHGGKKIVVASGSYSQSFTLPKGVELIGSDTKDVVITGILTMADKTKVSKVTLRTGGVKVMADADATLTKIKITDTIGVGIETAVGNGTLVLRDAVIEKTRKGLYIQNGAELQIEDAAIIDNREEGIDIRANVSGFIKKSAFRDNGESGIEVILGSADLLIQGNTFSGNGASGIATQFYEGKYKTGDVRIVNNTISGNTNYGIDCKAPSGGLESKDYYLNAISVSGNTFSKNREGEISKRCRVLTDEERIALAAKKAVRFDQTLSPIEFAERVQQNATARRAYEEMLKTRERERIEMALGDVAALLGTIEAKSALVTDRSPLACFLIGNNTYGKRALRQSITASEALLERLENEAGMLDFADHKKYVSDSTLVYRTKLKTLAESADTPRCGFSLFGWLNKSIAERRTLDIWIPDEDRGRISLFPDQNDLALLFVGNLGYSSKNRIAIMKNGDASFLAGIKDDLYSYDAVIADITTPMISEADPAPVQNSAVSLLFPGRFANVLAAHNIRLAHMGTSPLFRAQGQKGYEKTDVNMRLANITLLGGPSAEPASNTLFFKGIPVTFFDYREAKEAQPEMMMEKLEEARNTSKIVVLFVTHDPTLSTALTEERQTLMRTFAGAGADIVIGSGLPLAPQSELVGSRMVYYSLGNFWDGITLPGTDPGLAVTLRLGSDGYPVFEERSVSQSEEGAVVFAPK